MNISFQIHCRDPFYLQAVSEHRDLLEEMNRVRTLFDACAHGTPSATQAIELKRCVKGLHEHLTRHFIQEQIGGYLEEAIIRLPRIARQVEMLQREEAELLTAATRSLRQLERPGLTTRDWSCMAEEFEQFAKRLTAHESVEDALLQKAFNEDPGLEVS